MFNCVIHEISTPSLQEKKEDLKLAMGIASKSKDKPPATKAAGSSGPRVNKVRSIIEQLEKSKRELNTHCDAVTTALTDLNKKSTTPVAKSPRPVVSRFATSTPKSSSSTEPATPSKIAKHVPKKKVIEHIKKGFAEVLPDPDNREYQAEVIDLKPVNEEPEQKLETKLVEPEVTPDPEPEPIQASADIKKERTPSIDESLTKPTKIPSLKSRTPSVEKVKPETPPKTSRSSSVDSGAKKSKSPSVEPAVDDPHKSRSPSVPKSSSSTSAEKVPSTSADKVASTKEDQPLNSRKNSRTSAGSDSTTDDIKSIRKDSIPEAESEKSASRVMSRQASIVSSDISQTLNTTDATVVLKSTSETDENQVKNATGDSDASEKRADVVPTEVDARVLVDPVPVNLQQLKKTNIGWITNEAKTGE